VVPLAALAALLEEATQHVSGRIPGAAIVHTDNVAWYECAFNWVGLLTSGVLEPVRRGEAVAFCPPAWDARSREGAIEVPAGIALLLVEGVGSGRRSLAPLLDAVVYVQRDAEVSRDATKRGWPQVRSIRRTTSAG
jgi:hypothetical protein